MPEAQETSAVVDQRIPVGPGLVVHSKRQELHLFSVVQIKVAEVPLRLVHFVCLLCLFLILCFFCQFFRAFGSWRLIYTFIFMIIFLTLLAMIVSSPRINIFLAMIAENFFIFFNVFVFQFMTLWTFMFLLSSKSCSKLYSNGFSNNRFLGIFPDSCIFRFSNTIRVKG